MNTAAINYQASIAQLLPDEDMAPDVAAVKVAELVLDSRKVKPGSLFVAVKGYQDDGVRYIDAAVKQGAAAVLVDQEALSVVSQEKVPVVGIENLKGRLSEIAGRFFEEPSSRMDLVGITGTNGKTSCCQFIADALTYLGINCGVVGTTGYGMVGALRKTENTTPDAIAVQGILAELKQQKFNAVAMEVSSHGMDQGRVNAVHFGTAVFTNLSRDHLDYHADMAAYAECKARLFNLPKIRHAIINMDDKFGRQLAEQVPETLAVYGYSLERRDADISVSNLDCSAQGIKATIKTPWGEGILTSSLLGRFNLANLLVVIGVICVQGVSLPRALEAIAQLKGVPGRIERFGGNGLPLVVVDYAHTPDALEAVLGTLREFCDGELWCVFGCGGDRDQGKRGLMGEVAERLADKLVLTNDNPRSEDPENIVAGIKSGLSKPGQAVIELDRAQAIQMAVENTRAGDLVLVSGKGHEDWQEIKGARMAFSDAEQVKQALNIRRLAAKG